MPELPDLIYLEKKLPPLLAGQRLIDVEIKEPIVLRMLLPGDFAAALRGAEFLAVRRHGPFLVLALSEERELVIHPMLAGRFQWTNPNEKTAAGCALSLECEAPDKTRHLLHYLDDKKMGKVYLTRRGEYQPIPKFNTQGPDLLSAAFTPAYFHQKIKKSRQQVRVLIMDQAVVSCIGNAYADEILFDAGIHPKTFCYQLPDAAIARLQQSIVGVMRWGIAEVEKANPPLNMKARAHLRVRNRKDQPCPQCGTKIRRAGVRGFDTFFCPACQPLTRAQFIDWRKLDEGTA
ncbi:MAG: Formamidopyrimidine-DNA glycosylase [bacterium]|nr:Formamidopyrimidine-DNA glycosylase [bacterium]